MWESRYLLQNRACLAVPMVHSHAPQLVSCASDFVVFMSFEFMEIAGRSHSFNESGTLFVEPPHDSETKSKMEWVQSWPIALDIEANVIVAKLWYYTKGLGPKIVFAIDLHQIPL